MSKVRKPQGALEWNEKQVRAVLKKQGLVLGFDKIDGVRLIMRIDPYSEDKLTLRSRSGESLPALKDFHKKLLEVLKPDRWLDVVEFEGELTVVDDNGVNLPCKDTSGILQRKEQVDPCKLRWHLFDAVTGDPYRHNWYAHRWNYLREQMPLLAGMLGQVGTACQLLFGTPLRSIEEIEDHYERAIRMGLEGGIYRDPTCPPRAGKVLGMWKRKPVQTSDGVIIGLVEAKDKYGTPKAMIGSLEVLYEDGTLGRAGAGSMPHHMRTYYWHNKADIIGRYCEVKSMEDTGCGGLRHPVFSHFRDAVDNKGVKV